jgi:16S rRNA (guanine527-N7)-methyltransferase
MTSDGSPGLTELCGRYGLTEHQRGQLAALLAYLGSHERAPTSVRNPGLALDTHLADSLVALELEQVQAAKIIADLGSGAGFPGLPLAAALPASKVRLLDSQSRKCAFIGAAALAAKIGNAEVVCMRAEQWTQGAGAHDLVLVRAVGPQSVVLEYAAPLLRVGGTLVDWRGRRDPQDEIRSVASAKILGLERSEIRRTTPFAKAENRYLHVYLKVKDTPQRFPRRAGIARKRPLHG